ncbi:RNA helicase Mov10l1 isoform X2 [Entelurus aequoreus]|uniref:RNA helicase Mov10l1 isoform X2 n=1 Tax=Entelurus aequoreus TaxID=161455 RepID=UPI002B1E895C|nr:RNA helicase Mov10l1 isoform X2 [Entelurus aequoreus]
MLITSADMLSAVRYLLSKVISPLWRTTQVEANGGPSDAADSESISHVHDGVVTELGLDHGLIDGAIYFTSDMVLGGAPLKEGDAVTCIAVKDGAQGGWKARRVSKSFDAWETRDGTSLEDDCARLRPLIGSITSLNREGGYINQNTYFPRSSLCEGYEAMTGDCVQAKYFIKPDQWTTEAHSVAPLRYCRLNQVCVTSVCVNKGVVEDSVFFCLDSLMLPADYKPLRGHLVNLVMVESNQSFYRWRALCMAPCTKGLKSDPTQMSMTEMESLLENKGGLDVSTYGQFGDLMRGERRQLVLWIQNKGSETHRLKTCDFAGWDSEEQFFFSTVKTGREGQPRSGSSEDPAEEQGHHADETDSKEAYVSPGVRKEEREVDIPPGERLSIAVACQAKSLGSCDELLLLHFSSFIIGRRLEVTVCSEEERLLCPSAPYNPANAKHVPLPATPSHVITLTAPTDIFRLSKRRLPCFLPSYNVPQSLRHCVAAQKDVLVVRPCLGEVLSASNAQARFSTLLWLEELNAEKELEEFTVHGSLLRKGALYLHLEVLGLAEGRPYLNIGDRIVLKMQQSNGMVVECVSCVVEINDEDVSLKVNSEFQRCYLGEPLDVEFSLNRMTMRRCHHAVEQTKSFVEIFFPSRVTPQSPLLAVKWVDEDDTSNTLDGNKAAAKENEQLASISFDMKSKATQTKDGAVPVKPIPSLGHFFNPNLNPSQRDAVKRIMAAECRPTPYVLFGPPGTGKTITLIEAILQVYHFLPSSRVLVCTPSNSAADLICIRLHDSGFLHAASMARINASCRQEKCIPEMLRQYSRAGEDISQASLHRIVVSTCSSAGMFFNLGLQVGHFTHVFLDEAGQATEPESLIPISLISEEDGQLVLAGDPCQLGPIVKSKVAAAFGLGVSMLERLMANPLYARQEWGYNPKLVTKLIYNYRSHEALLTMPSKLFYHGELCVKAPKAVVDSLCKWKTLPKKGFPLLFHGVRGKEMREGNNPSWFNPVEAVQAMMYSCQLAKKSYQPVAASEIGIIAPYRKQCEKIRILLAKAGLSDIKVGSVEEFQGQEFLVIIVSTVRSNESVKSDDLQSALGFLTNPKRFNVAITRSKALLLIIGNPHILIRDPCFGMLLHYCYTSGAYVGCDPPSSIRDTKIAAIDPGAA